MKETKNQESIIDQEHRSLLQKATSMYGTEDMQEESGIVTMAEALAINKTLTQNRIKLIKTTAK